MRDDLINVRFTGAKKFWKIMWLYPTFINHSNSIVLVQVNECSWYYQHISELQFWIVLNLRSFYPFFQPLRGRTMYSSNIFCTKKDRSINFSCTKRIDLYFFETKKSIEMKLYSVKTYSSVLFHVKRMDQYFFYKKV